MLLSLTVVIPGLLQITLALFSMSDEVTGFLMFSTLELLTEDEDPFPESTEELEEVTFDVGREDEKDAVDLRREDFFLPKKFMLTFVLKVFSTGN
jgi:hypothetical protein